MTLERLQPPAHPGRPWRVELEDGEVLQVPEGTVADHALYQGMELEEAGLEELRRAADAAALRGKAASLLTGRMLSAAALREKLCAKGASPEQAEEVSQWAEEIGLLNDAAYAHSLVAHYEARGYGIYKIKDELYRRRIPQEYWEEALAQMGEPDEAIDRFLSARVTDPEDRKQVKKASDALVRRGFSWSQVSEGIARLRSDYEWRD